MKEHPNCQVEVQAFENLKPYYVRISKEWNIYACKQHVEMTKPKHGYNNMQFVANQKIHGSNCNCSCDV
jgi:hypothetical protein